MKVIMTKIGQNDVPMLRIEASRLSLNDEFMQHVPETPAQQVVKDRLIQQISDGMKDFYKAWCDPSITRDGKIAFVEGKIPAIGKKYSWWLREADSVFPEFGSRLGTDKEYIAFVGVLLKELSWAPIFSGDPWRAICDDSTNLGHYWNSKNFEGDYEKTGQRQILHFLDLANVFKVLKSSDGKPGFCIASGSFKDEGFKFPIASISHRVRDCALEHGVGWIVFDGRM